MVICRRSKAMSIYPFRPEHKHASVILVIIGSGNGLMPVWRQVITRISGNLANLLEQMLVKKFNQNTRIFLPILVFENDIFVKPQCVQNYCSSFILAGNLVWNGSGLVFVSLNSFN